MPYNFEQFNETYYDVRPTETVLANAAYGLALVQLRDSKFQDSLRYFKIVLNNVSENDQVFKPAVNFWLKKLNELSSTNFTDTSPRVGEKRREEILRRLAANQMSADFKNNLLDEDGKKLETARGSASKTLAKLQEDKAKIQHTYSFKEKFEQYQNENEASTSQQKPRVPTSKDEDFSVIEIALSECESMQESKNIFINSYVVEMNNAEPTIVPAFKKEQQEELSLAGEITLPYLSRVIPSLKNIAETEDDIDRYRFSRIMSRVESLENRAMPAETRRRFRYIKEIEESLPKYKTFLDFVKIYELAGDFYKTRNPVLSAKYYEKSATLLAKERNTLQFQLSKFDKDSDINHETLDAPLSLTQTQDQAYMKQIDEKKDELYLKDFQSIDDLKLKSEIINLRSRLFELKMDQPIVDSNQELDQYFKNYATITSYLRYDDPLRHSFNNHLINLLVNEKTDSSHLKKYLALATKCMSVDEFSTINKSLYEQAQAADNTRKIDALFNLQESFYKTSQKRGTLSLLSSMGAIIFAPLYGLYKATIAPRSEIIQIKSYPHDSGRDVKVSGDYFRKLQVSETHTNKSSTYRTLTELLPETKNAREVPFLLLKVKNNKVQKPSYTTIATKSAVKVALKNKDMSKKHKAQSIISDPMEGTSTQHYPEKSSTNRFNKK